MLAEPVASPRRVTRTAVKGSATPRIAPPVPASDVTEFRQTAEGLGITLMPAQITAARYIEAKNRKGKHLYREVGIEWARQNGKTTIVKPLIVKALRAGLRVLHIADKRELPREMHALVADALSSQPELFPKRRGKILWPRYGQGQEEIALVNGGHYRIASAKKGGARGWPADILIIDELRELEDFNVISAASSTLLTSVDPLTIYLSNEGDDDAVVLHSVKMRAGKDKNLAWLEWSADPEYATDDERGWLQANPAIGHMPSVLPWLRAEYQKHLLAGTLAIFETENLCRSVPSLTPKIVTDTAWVLAKGDIAEPPRRPTLGVKLDPSGTRLSAAIAWQLSDGRVAMRVVLDEVGNPLDVKDIIEKVRVLRVKLGAKLVGLDDWTDKELGRALPGAKAINGREFANASATFANVVDSGRLVWDEAEQIGLDLAHAGRQKHEGGAWIAVASKDDYPITALLAAIRAVWLASGNRAGTPRIH